jgi:hypothetical protein
LGEILVLHLSDPLSHLLNDLVDIFQDELELKVFEGKLTLSGALIF